MGVNEVSNSNQVKKTTIKQTNQHHKKGSRKLAKSCKCAISVSDCLSKNCQVQAV